MAAPDREPLANVGSSPLERIYQMLVIIDLHLMQAFNLTDTQDTFFTQPTGSVSPNINPNFPGQL